MFLFCLFWLLFRCIILQGASLWRLVRLAIKSKLYFKMYKSILFVFPLSFWGFLIPETKTEDCRCLSFVNLKGVPISASIAVVPVIGHVLKQTTCCKLYPWFPLRFQNIALCCYRTHYLRIMISESQYLRLENKLIIVAFEY